MGAAANVPLPRCAGGRSGDHWDRSRAVRSPARHWWATHLQPLATKSPARCTDKQHPLEHHLSERSRASPLLKRAVCSRRTAFGDPRMPARPRPVGAARPYRQAVRRDIRLRPGVCGGVIWPGWSSETCRCRCLCALNWSVFTNLREHGSRTQSNTYPNRRGTPSFLSTGFKSRTETPAGRASETAGAASGIARC